MRRLAALSICAAVLAPALTATADTIVFRQGALTVNDVVVDSEYDMEATWIRANDTDANFGGSDQILAGSNMTSGPLRTLMQIDVSRIATIAGGLPVEINSAQIDFRTANQVGVGTGLQLNVHAYGFATDEDAATWEDPDGDGDPATGDTTGGGTVGDLLTSLTFNPNGAGQSRTIPDTLELRAAIADAVAGDGRLGLLYKDANEGTDARLFTRMDSDDVGTVENRPALVVDFTVIPEPATMGLLGLGGLAVLRRRRR